MSEHAPEQTPEQAPEVVAPLFPTEHVLNTSQAALTEQEHLDRVKADAEKLAVTLRDASDAGVPHGLILPQLVLVFREAFGEMPEGMQLPGMTL